MKLIDFFESCLKPMQDKGILERYKTCDCGSLAHIVMHDDKEVYYLKIIKVTDLCLDDLISQDETMLTKLAAHQEFCMNLIAEYYAKRQTGK